MAILVTGNTFATGNQVTATNLNAAVNSATFDTGAVDGSTTQLSGGAIIVKDGGITSAKLATNIAVAGTLSAGSDITATVGSFIRSGVVGVRGLYYQTSGSNRWIAYADSVAETGSNAGSNFAIAAYSDAAAGLGDYLTINRATGAIAMPSGGGLAVTGDVSVSTKTPASASAAGVAGTITWDANYIYVCTATNTWKRVAIATW